MTLPRPHVKAARMKHFLGYVPCAAAVLLAASGAGIATSAGDRSAVAAVSRHQPERIATMAKPNDFTPPDRSTPLPLPRDPEVAVREEFEIASTRGTAEAWQLFISRHGGHRLAAEARKELERLKGKP